jgi:hypothetical protein
MNLALNREASSWLAELRRLPRRDRYCRDQGRQQGTSDTPGLADRCHAPATPGASGPSHAPSCSRGGHRIGEPGSGAMTGSATRNRQCLVPRLDGRHAQRDKRDD